jgi:hypothetical protein
MPTDLTFRFGTPLMSLRLSFFFLEPHQGALLRHFAVISELLEHMETLGWKPYQADHEVKTASYP